LPLADDDAIVVVHIQPVLRRAKVGTCLAPLCIPKEARMAQRSLSERVEALEETVAGLQGLPNQLASMKAQIDTQFEQISERFEEVDARFAQVDARFAQVDARFAQVDARFDKVDAQFKQLRQEVHDGDEETRHQMRILHEEVIARIAMLGDNGAR
jgi:chromosome segregation ATPase